MKKITALLIAILMVFALSACDVDVINDTSTGNVTNGKNEENHTHSYSDATCTKAATCTCGATDSAPLGHTWNEATCTSAKNCSRCGATSGSALGHSFDKGKCSQRDATDPNYFEPLVFSGSGDKIITGVNLTKGLYKISLTNKGSRNFIVVPYDGDGDRKSSWSNEIGDYSGSVIYSDSLTDGYIEVKSSGQWTITISKDFGTGTSNLTGAGDCVSPFFTLKDGALVVDLLNTGNSNFIVVVYDENGNRYSSLANEIGDYKGQAMFNRGKNGMRYCIEVVSQGTWSINFGIEETVTSVTTN